jgi:predicted aspartyl protease
MRAGKVARALAIKAAVGCCLISPAYGMTMCAIPAEHGTGGEMTMIRGALVDTGATFDAVTYGAAQAMRLAGLATDAPPVKIEIGDGRIIERQTIIIREVTLRGADRETGMPCSAVAHHVHAFVMEGDGQSIIGRSFLNQFTLFAFVRGKLILQTSE